MNLTTIPAAFWKVVRSNRFRIIALILILSFFVPPPAHAQFGLIFGLMSLISSGLGTLNSVMTNVNSTLKNVIGPILENINSVMSEVQKLSQWIFNFQQNVVYPLSSITAARELIGTVQGIYTTMEGYWSVMVHSATLPNTMKLESVMLSRNATQIPLVNSNFSAVYTALPAAADAHPAQRELIDSSDAVSQAAMKRAIAIDAIADQELAAAEQMMKTLKTAAPGTAEMVGAQAGVWTVRSHAYTEQALAELMRLRTIELAGQSARMKEAARFTREARTKTQELNP